MFAYVLLAIIVILATTVWFLWPNTNTPTKQNKEIKEDDENEIPEEDRRELEEQAYFDSFAKGRVEEMRELPFVSLCDEIEEPYMSEVLVDHLHEYGFAVLNLKETDKKLVNDMFKALETFMKSSTDVKLAASTSEYQGYSLQKSMGFETFQFKYTDDKDFNWPSNPPNFEELAKKYFMFMHNTACFMLRLLARHLKCDPSFFLNDINSFPLPPTSSSSSTLRLFRYFNNTGGDMKDLTHIDIDLLTLLPVSKNSGLQIYVESMRRWIEVEKTAPRGDLIFFPGSILQLITNGYLKGTIHRVVRGGNSERYSMPLAFLPRMDSTIKVVDSPTVDEDFEHNITLGFKLPMRVDEFVQSQYRARALKRSNNLSTDLE